MSCGCCDGSKGMTLPVEAPAPTYARSEWPSYFVPDPKDPRWGTWHCPRCGIGQPQATSMDVPQVRTLWQRLTSWWGSKNLLAT